MQVKVREIPQEGLTLSEPFDPEALQLQTDQLQFVLPLMVTATFERQRDTVLVKAQARGEIRCVCGRCLEEYPKAYTQEVRLDYSVKGIEVLDVTDDIRQEILLSYPVTFLCRSTCRGLCPRCGENRNRGPCACERK